ncbi:hypothetical protein UF75_4984 [Desulfosporosinus sp. I2]|nr:hypothetical protein UF75_4984 [Desulfosporosinus sp. I2]
MEAWLRKSKLRVANIQDSLLFLSTLLGFFTGDILARIVL